MRCRACGYVLFFNVAAAVAGIIEDDTGRVLLVERATEPAKGALDLPGGFVEPGETAEEALAREVREELDLSLRRDSLRYLGSFPNTYAYAGVTYWTLDAAFACTVETLAYRDVSGEIASVMFFAPEDIPIPRVGFASIRNILQAYRETRRREAL
ncbi:MAG TPA: NUDIX domain-containing protein [Deltaproteobacteria bacterium]|nr:NUDIX domain-containing protein [Deltaproteobacteria bacterium]